MNLNITTWNLQNNYNNVCRKHLTESFTMCILKGIFNYLTFAYKQKN